MRFSLLTPAVAIFVAHIVSGPLAINVSHWSATAPNRSLAGLMALACFAFYAARGAQPLFGLAA